MILITYPSPMSLHGTIFRYCTAESKKSENQEVQKVGNCVTLSITLYFQGRMAICAHFLMPTQETTEEHACLASSPISQTQCSQKTGCMPREVITQVAEVSRLSSDIEIMSFCRCLYRQWRKLEAVKGASIQIRRLQLLQPLVQQAGIINEEVVG